MKLQGKVYTAILLSIALFSGFATANETKTKREKRANQPLQINVTAWGPTQEAVDAAKLRVERSRAVQNELAGTKYRIFGFEYVENNPVKSQPSAVPTRFRVVFYDYTNDRTLIAEGDFAATEEITVRAEFSQPNPTDEEFEEAVRIVRSDERFGSMLRGDRLRTFEPMPPVTILEGTTERLVNVGLEAFGDRAKNEVVSVSIKRGVVIRYEEGAPVTSKAEPDACGIPSAGQGSTTNGTAGQYQLSVMENGSPLWEMLVIRPSASSGRTSERSGIEVRDVKYKGKSVMKRGHAPILNVSYTGNVCGPYRDWQYAEGFFDAPTTGATDPAPGIRVLGEGQIATTALDTGNDTGNFRGVAIYQQDSGFGNEIVMVSEMNAGWYRYIMEWRFAPDGTIRPRYGYGATNSSCVCAVHHHHTYWRFDFDIVQPENKIFQVGSPNRINPRVGGKVMSNETMELRSYLPSRSYLIQNSAGNEAYLLSPNTSDGNTDDYGGGDFWFLQYKGTGGEPLELDDPNTSTAANISAWINLESLVNRDVVVWYAAHFIHADGANLLNPDRSGNVLSGSHVVGPDIRPVRW